MLACDFSPAVEGSDEIVELIQILIKYAENQVELPWHESLVNLQSDQTDRLSLDKVILKCLNVCGVFR